MPARYDYRAGNTRISCSRCDAYVTVEGRPSNLSGTEQVVASYDAQQPPGSLVSNWLRWLPNRNRYHAWCRSCERAARQEAAASGGNRQSRRAPRVTSGGTARRFENRKFGIELELIYPRTVTRYVIGDALAAAGLTGWRVKTDGSLSGGNGLEVVSPPLVGEAGMDALQVACRVLRRLGGKPNRSCGTHVHHDIADLDVEAIKRVAHGWSNNQSLIDGLVSQSRRNGGNYYARELSPSDLLYIDRATSLSQMRQIGVQRYRTMNLASYSRYGTVEIRQHQGTCDFEKIRSWVMLGQAIIDAAKAGALNRQSSIRAFLDGLGDLMDETAKTFTLGRALQFGHATV